MTYTKEQLIDAMEIYYAEVKDNPSKFNSDYEYNTRQEAIDCIEYLLELVKCDK